jgi:hypothetical protein
LKKILYIKNGTLRVELFTLWQCDHCDPRQAYVEGYLTILGLTFGDLGKGLNSTLEVVALREPVVDLPILKQRFSQQDSYCLRRLKFRPLRMKGSKLGQG